MKVVHKFPMAAPLMTIPAGEIVHVAAQRPTDDWPTVWMLRDPDDTALMQTVEIRGTGHPVEDNLTHVGSAVCAEGYLVWHVFLLGAAS